MQIRLLGEVLELLPQRAVYWQAQRMLLIADIHFGKATAFRSRGFPVPRGTTSQNLLALEQLLAARDIGHILFLGDFLHAKAAHSPATMAALRQWRARFSALKLTLVRGNHDLHAGDPPEELEIELVNEPHHLGPFAFCHHPHLAGVTTKAYVIAGHLHPVYSLAGRADRVRLPCFLFNEMRGILPSFGAFTGGYLVSPSPRERLFLTTGDAVFEVPRR
ncbi:ligase-associated DNA damage response endonuclease PdeM [soil metagenome]